MRKLCFLIIISIAINACNFIEPKGVISEEKLTDLLVDLYLTDTQIQYSIDTLTTKRLNDTAYLKSKFSNVFENHGVTFSDFTKSINYYTLKLEKIDNIYKNVINKLSEIEAEEEKTVN